MLYKNFTAFISIHALLAESDWAQNAALAWAEFLSTLSLRRATLASLRPRSTAMRFLSTLSLRRATQHYGSFRDLTVISIHALLAESDRTKSALKHVIRISIHALLAESDAATTVSNQKTVIFLSTLSLRRATQSRKISPRSLMLFLSTLSLRRAT